VEDEARLRELAADLEPVDAPPSMWQAIEARLAEAEIGDSRRPAFSLFLQRALDGVRRNSLVLGVGGAAVAVLVFLVLPGGGESIERPRVAVAPVEAAGPPERPAAEPACSGTHEEQLLCQMHEADRRYLDAIAELGQAVAEERAFWTAADAALFDAALAELDRAAELERVRLAGQPPTAGPAVRDPLYAIYRRQIDLLTSAVVAGDLSGAARRGGP
jgi:hypothetical protein